MDRWDRVWADQQDFNAQIRPVLPQSYEERTALTKELVLHDISESDELLRACGAWKPHRRVMVPENRAHVIEEMIDKFKYLISIAQVWGVTPAEFLDAYWWKSMAVRQRHSEEFLTTLAGPTVIVDIDNVLADYIGGFANFLDSEGEPEAANMLRTERPYMTAASMAGYFHPERWSVVKHEFRVKGWKRILPVHPGAYDFLWWCSRKQYFIVLVTSRPIDEYPNIYADTIHWLKVNQLPFDFIWWSEKKGRLLADRRVVPLVKFAVDDDIEYCAQFLGQGIKTYWLNNGKSVGRLSDGLIQVPTLQALVEFEEDERDFIQRYGA